MKKKKKKKSITTIWCKCFKSFPSSDQSNIMTFFFLGKKKKNESPIEMEVHKVKDSRMANLSHSSFNSSSGVLNSAGFVDNSIQS